MAEKTQVYFSLYFAMTGMHALHMIIGVSLLTILLIQAWGGKYVKATWRPSRILGCTGTCRHCLDFLFPLLYLISRHQ